MNSFIEPDQEHFEPEIYLALRGANQSDTLSFDALGPFLELEIDPEIASFFFNEEHPNTPPFGPSCTLSLKVYLGAEAKKEVVSRDTDIMTENEMITHKR